MREKIGKPGPPPFTEYLVYGPTLHRKEGRRMIFLVGIPPQIPRTTISYARYLVSVKLGRRLGAQEHVDHIDGDKLNDSLDNLQLLSPAENNRKGKSRTLVPLTCAECGKDFTRRKGSEPQAKGYRRAFCSRPCLHRSLKSANAPIV